MRNFTSNSAQFTFFPHIALWVCMQRVSPCALSRGRQKLTVSGTNQITHLTAAEWNSSPRSRLMLGLLSEVGQLSLFSECQTPSSSNSEWVVAAFCLPAAGIIEFSFLSCQTERTEKRMKSIVTLKPEWLQQKKAQTKCVFTFWQHFEAENAENN